MLFWTILVVSMFVMTYLYLSFTFKRIIWVVFVYTILVLISIAIVYLWFRPLFVEADNDWLALIIPYLVLVPTHIFVKTLILPYTIPSDKQVVKYFVSYYSRFIRFLTFVLIVLLIGFLMALWDALTISFNSYNIWSMSVTGVVMVITVIFQSSMAVKKQFSFILIVGKKEKQVYRLKLRKSRIHVKKVFGREIPVYPRGVYQENNEIQYVYWTPKEKVNRKNLESYQSDLYESIKKGASKHETLENLYNEYIDRKSAL